MLYVIITVALFSAIGFGPTAMGAVRAEVPNARAPAYSTRGDGVAPPDIQDQRALADFFDALIPAQLEQRRIPGAVVAVVEDGELTFSRGYGWADLDGRVPVDAERTLFHIGSNGKLFTWTAVMQLVEQGRLDLDADINTYLDFQVPATYPEPITLKHLMTHTAGFENRDLGWLAPSPEAVTPLGRWLAANIPARVRPPGQEVGYSNYGAALAGYIVERVAGTSYPDYVEQHLLAPLNMERSTVRQRVPAGLAPDVAKGYVFEAGRFREEPLSTYQGTPAGTIRATAPDVARFMLAHLQDGRTPNGRLLQEATARQMRQALFRPDPRVNGLAHGFLEMDRNGERIVGHMGSAAPVHYSLLVLLPDRGVGLFVAYNADTARPLTVGNQTLAAFMDRFFPAPAAAPPSSPDFVARADQYSGAYRRNNFGGSYTTVEKLGRVLNAATDRRVSNPRDGTLAVDSRLWGSTHFVEVEPGLFRQVDGSEWLVFRRDRAGQVAKASFGGEPEYTFERVPLSETVPFTGSLLGGCAVLFGSALLAPAASRARRRRRGDASGSRFSHTARRLAGAVAVGNLVFLVGLLVTLGDPALLAGDFSRLRLLLVLPLLTTALSAGMLVCALLAWRRRAWSLPARLHYSAVGLGSVGFTWFLITWNLLGFRL
jgi:CubicO group peptidase (beta-lactamase class C family)